MRFKIEKMQKCSKEGFDLYLSVLHNGINVEKQNIVCISCYNVSPSPLRHTALPAWPIWHNLSFPKHPHITHKYTLHSYLFGLDQFYSCDCCWWLMGLSEDISPTMAFPPIATFPPPAKIPDFISLTPGPSINSKSEKVSRICFSASTKLRKQWINLAGKILCQKGIIIRNIQCFYRHQTL